MDYADWVGRVFAALEDAQRAAEDGSRRVPFLRFPSICRFLEVEVETPGSEETEAAGAVMDALQDLEWLGLVKLVEHPLTYQMTQHGRKVAQGGLSTIWGSIFRSSADLDDEQLLVLRRAADLGQVPGGKHVRALAVPVVQIHSALREEFGIEWAGPRGESKILHIYRDLGDMGLARLSGGRGGERMRPTYSGVVRTTRKETTEWQTLIQALLPDWENTNVDFKRELKLGRDKEKAEFVRDVLGLANTKSPGRRFLVIGFGPKSRVFEVSVDPDNDQDRMENILNSYADPAPRILYRIVPWESGSAGVVEVVREPYRLPYKVERNFAHLRAGGIFVRHGSHTEEPTPAELASLVAEGEHARSSANGASD